MSAAADVEMVVIPPTTFRMGSDRDDAEERAVHRVSVDDVWIDGTPLADARLHGAPYAWGQRTSSGRQQANAWQGQCPWPIRRADGSDGTSPVDAFPPHGGYGVYDMIGDARELR